MFWGEFRRPLAMLDRCMLNKGAFAFKIVREALKWLLKGGSRLIQVAATAGLTVYHILIKYYQFTCCIENSVDPDQLASSETS